MGMFGSLVANVIQKALLAESHYGLPSSYRPPSLVVYAGSQEAFRDIFAQVWLGRPIVGRGWVGLVVWGQVSGGGLILVLSWAAVLHHVVLRARCRPATDWRPASSSRRPPLY